FSSLSVAVGRKYLFCHGGRCEHAVSSRGVGGLLTRRDTSSAPEKFPREVWRTRPFARRCQTCDKRTAGIVTYADRMSKETPGFFCRECFSSAH
ncbi:hypothetical protein GUITHDRAFT_50248, partial [Guillardia theta CCMP2712]